MHFQEWKWASDQLRQQLRTNQLKNTTFVHYSNHILSDGASLKYLYHQRRHTPSDISQSSESKKPTSARIGTEKKLTRASGHDAIGAGCDARGSRALPFSLAKLYLQYQPQSSRPCCFRTLLPCHCRRTLFFNLSFRSAGADQPVMPPCQALPPAPHWWSNLRPKEINTTLPICINEATPRAINWQLYKGAAD